METIKFNDVEISVADIERAGFVRKEPEGIEVRRGDCTCRQNPMDEHSVGLLHTYGAVDIPIGPLDEAGKTWWRDRRRGNMWTVAADDFRVFTACGQEWLDRYDMRENGGEVCGYISSRGKHRIASIDLDGDFVYSGACIHHSQAKALCRSIRQAVIKHKEGK